MITDKLSVVKLGLNKILEDSTITAGGRIGLICNPASVDHSFRHAADLFNDCPHIHLTTLFGPQHGIRGDVQDNMIETKHSLDQHTRLRIFSLYSETREPTEEMLADVDALVFDLQDVGCRVYTFIYTLANAMKACARLGKRMIVLDRPNPINGADVEGNILERGHESFVGMYPIPMRHGLTSGELAMLFNKCFGIGCELDVVTMEGWDRNLYYDNTNAPWVMPSPNMPTCDTAAVFPGTVYFEGTQFSEGRGTTRPFEIVGAPYVDSYEYAEAMNSLDLAGVTFRPVRFIPTFQKHAGDLCGGVFVHVLDRVSFRSVLSGIALVKTAYELYHDSFAWKEPPYEYVYDRNPFDVIHGSTKLRETIDAGTSIMQIAESWRAGEAKFRETRNEFLLY